MKSISKILLAALLLGSAAYAYAGAHPSAKIFTANTEDRHLSGFNAVSVEGPFDVYITQGNTESVKVEAPADVIGRILTEVKGGVLRVYSKRENWHWGNWWGNHKKMAVYVTAKDLNSIHLSGSGDVFFKQGITTNSLKLSIVGSGDVTGSVNVKVLESSISGSGDMRLSGRADNSTVRVVGSGDFRARDLVTVNTAVHISGSGDASINASNKIDASVSGSGDIHYTGAAKNISSSKSGSGDISRM
jgi:hypothetical protein